MDNGEYSYCKGNTNIEYGKLPVGDLGLVDTGYLFCRCHSYFLHSYFGVKIGAGEDFIMIKVNLIILKT